MIASNVHETQDHSEDSSHIHGDKSSHGTHSGNQGTELMREKLVKHLDKKHFIQQIFDEFGDGEVITMDGFEHLLENLQLSQMVEKPNSIGDSGIFSTNSSKSNVVNASEQSQRLNSSVLLLSNVSSAERLNSDLKLEQPEEIKCDKCESKGKLIFIRYFHIYLF